MLGCNRQAETRAVRPKSATLLVTCSIVTCLRFASSGVASTIEVRPVKGSGVEGTDGVLGVGSNEITLVDQSGPRRGAG